MDNIRYTEMKSRMMKLNNMVSSSKPNKNIKIIHYLSAKD